MPARSPLGKHLDAAAAGDFVAREQSANLFFTNERKPVATIVTRSVAREQAQSPVREQAAESPAHATRKYTWSGRALAAFRDQARHDASIMFMGGILMVAAGVALSIIVSAFHVAHDEWPTTISTLVMNPHSHSGTIFANFLSIGGALMLLSGKLRRPLGAVFDLLICISIILIGRMHTVPQVDAAAMLRWSVHILPAILVFVGLPFIARLKVRGFTTKRALQYSFFAGIFFLTQVVIKVSGGDAAVSRALKDVSFWSEAAAVFTTAVILHDVVFNYRTPSRS